MSTAFRFAKAIIYAVHVRSDQCKCMSRFHLHSLDKSRAVIASPEGDQTGQASPLHGGFGAV